MVPNRLTPIPYGDQVSKIESWDISSLEIKVIICYQDEIKKLVQF